MRESAQKVRELLRLARGRRRALIVTHDNPDPDALASAVALAHLLSRKAGMKAKVAYGGIVGRAENTAMIRVLRLPVHHLTAADLAASDLVALMDTQPAIRNHSLPRSRVPDVVVDHHPEREGTRLAAFADVGRHKGATSTLVLEYLRAAGVKPDTRVATALFYGIKTDTRDLERQASRVDVESYLYLYPLVDRAALSRIEHPRLPASYFQLYHRALERAQVHAHAVTVDLGRVYTPDMVPEVAERLLSLEGMRWSLAAGTWKGQLFLSARTNDPRGNAGRLMRAICEHLGGSSGGHGAMAGACLPLAGRRPDLRRQLFKEFLVGFGVRDEVGRPLLEQ